MQSSELKLMAESNPELSLAMQDLQLDHDYQGIKEQNKVLEALKEHTDGNLGKFLL